MNKEDREHFIKWVRKDIEESIASTLESLLPPAVLPVAYVNIADREVGLYIDPMDEDDEENASIVPWADFADHILDNDLDLIERYQPLFRELADRMEKHIHEANLPDNSP